MMGMNMATLPQLALAGLAMVAAVGQPAVAGDERSIRFQEAQRELDAQRQARFNLIKAVQQALADAGYDPGPADGLEGPRTTAAVTAYQRDKGLKVDGTIGPETLRSLGLID